VNTAITFLQIFGIGFSFGIIGPCFLVCTPVLITYVVASKKEFILRLKDIVVFFFGRLLAYVSLGFLAGLSALVLRQFASSKLVLFFRPLSGIISILLGLFILMHKDDLSFACKSAQNKVYNFGSLFLLGFIVGITPCAPLVALLFEITLISKTPFTGMFYALFFGLGAFLSGLLVVGTFTGILTGVTARLLRSEKSRLIFRIICALLLILLGAGLLLGRYALNLNLPTM
jgi:sulfite exporter TauE/SafE